MGAFFVVLLSGMLFWYQAHGKFDYDVAQSVLRSSESSEAAKEAARITMQRLSIFFTFYVLLQFWNLFNARRFGSTRSVFDKPFDNTYFWAIAGIILFGQFVITQFGGAVFSTYPLTMMQWLTLLAASSLILVLGEGVRLFNRSG